MGKNKKKSDLLREIQQLKTSSRSKNESREASFRRFEQKAASQGMKSIRAQKGQLKMSDIMHDFLAPYTSETPTLSEYHNLLPLALVAWNTALLPPERHNVLLNSFIQVALPNSDPIANHDLRRLLEAMVQDKLENFAEYDRAITDYDVYEVDGEIQLSIASRITQLDESDS
jgi:hypothetical protein